MRPLRWRGWVIERGWRLIAVAGCVGFLLGAAPPRPLSDIRVSSGGNETIIRVWVGRGSRVVDRTRQTPGHAPGRSVRPSAVELEEASGAGPGGRRDDKGAVGAAVTPGRGSGPEKKESETASESSASPAASGSGRGEDEEPAPRLLGSGETFLQETRFFLPDNVSARATSITVGDPRVSEVRVLPGRQGSTLVVFLRQAVHYDLWRSADEEAVAIHLRAGGTTLVAGEVAAKTSGEHYEGREVSVDAQTVRFDRDENVLIARGEVAIRRAGLMVSADEIRVHRDTDEAEATGDVVLSNEDSMIRGDYLSLNLSDETGWIENGSIDLKEGGYLITGQRIEKGFGQMYRTDNGVVTTCRCGGLEVPSWSIAARKLDIDLLGSGLARHMTFRVHDVPVLYLPFGVIPVNRTRQSGFLLPRIAQSFSTTNDRGFQYEQPFFWAIDKSSDATISFDLESAARVGGVGEYRYARSARSRGILSVAYWNEMLRSRESFRRTVAQFEESGIVERPPNDRWGLFTDLRQRLPAGVQAYADTLLVSDDLFFTETQSASFQPAATVAARTTFFTATRVGLFKRWESASVWGETTYYQDLDLVKKNEDEVVLQRLPRIEFRVRRATLGDRVGLSFAGEAIDYQRVTGFDGLRLDLRPEMRIPFHIGRFLRGGLEGGIRETLYHMTDAGLGRLECRGGQNDGQPCAADSDCSAGGTCVEAMLDSNNARGSFYVGGRVGTEVSRVFTLHRWGFDRLKHTIEPTIGYLFVPSINEQDELPLYDGVDRINRRSLVSYGLVSRLRARVDTGQPDDRVGDGELRPAPSVRELARVSLLQVYDTERKIGGRCERNKRGNLVCDKHFSDADFSLRLTPHDAVSLEYGATYNVAERQLQGASVTFSLHEPWRARTAQLGSLQNPSSLAISYRFVGENIGAVEGPGQEDLDGSVYLRLGRLFGLVLQGRLNLIADSNAGQSMVREIGIGGRYVSRCECWMVEVGVENRAEPVEETVLRTQVTLLGIGSLGRTTGQGFVAAPTTAWRFGRR